jgi:hypothetical protein
MRFPRGPFLAALALLAIAGAARADDPKPGDAKPKDAPKADKPAKKAPAAAEAIAWRGQWSEAAEEARERGILVMLHSHGST